MRLQGDRGRLPVGLADRLRLRAPADRGGPDPRRRHHPGADAGARRADRAHLRGAARRPARDRASLQLDLARCSAASCSASTAPASSTSPCAARALIQRAGRARCRRPTCASSIRPESFTGTELEFAVEICEAVMDVWQPTPRAQGDPQPAGDRRDGHAQHLRRPDRVVRAATSRGRDSHRAVAAPAQRPRHRRRRRRARA